MVDGIFDPLPSCPYYLRILNPETDRDMIHKIRVRSLKSIRFWNDLDPGIRSLANPMPYGHYAELVHREKGSTGLSECFSYADAAVHTPGYPLLHYFDEFLSDIRPRINFHLRTLYLHSEFQRSGSGMLFLILLNGIYYQHFGVTAMTFTFNTQYNKHRKLYLSFGAVELDSLNERAATDGLKDVRFCYFDIETVLERCSSIFRQRYPVRNAQDIAILADSNFWGGPETTEFKLY